MKILHVCETDYGGAGTAALRLHLGLKSLGFRSKMLVLQRRSKDNDIVEIGNGCGIFKKAINKVRRRLISLETDRAAMRANGVFTDNKSIYRISGHPLVKEADVINLHWVKWLFDFKRFFSETHGKPVTWTLHDMNPFTGGCHYSAGCKKYEISCGSCPQLRFNSPNDLSRRIWKEKEASYGGKDISIVTPSRWLAACAKKSPLFKDYETHVIPHGLPTDIFRKQDKHSSRRFLKLPRDKILILFGADYKTERKGFKYLTDALGSLEKRTDTSKIALVTFGPKQKIDNLYDDTGIAVCQLGYIYDQTLLSSVYSSCDMFVAPSVEEAFGQTCLESMSCGTPVIGFDAGGMQDMITPHETGLLAELKNPRDLAGKIEYMTTHAEERKRLAENARKFVEEECTLKTQARRYLKIYETMAPRLNSYVNV